MGQLFAPANGQQIKSIQRGWTASTSIGVPASVTISSVDMSKTLVRYNGVGAPSLGSTGAVMQMIGEVYLLNTTTLRINYWPTGGFTAWEVVEYT